MSICEACGGSGCINFRDSLGRDTREPCDRCASTGLREPRPCPTKTPEPHGAGEFPMTCYRCHIEADS